jgi:serine/threonine protein kinase
MTKLLQMIHGRYLIHRKVGSGGFGTVYQADDTLLQRPVALKEIAVTSQTATVPHRSPLYEARMLASYPHPHIPHVYDVFSWEASDDESLYIVMEWIEGVLLTSYRQSLASTPFLACVQLSMQLCRVVQFLHEKNIILRDIKPGNILVTRTGKIYLVDFGTLIQYTPGLPRDIDPCWSYGYEAPELMERRAQSSPVTDIYSLGLTLYELFFQRSLIFEDGKPAIQFPECEDLARLLCSMTAKDPSHRPQTVREIQKQFRHLLAYARTHPSLSLKDKTVFGSDPLDSNPF